MTKATPPSRRHLASLVLLLCATSLPACGGDEGASPGGAGQSASAGVGPGGSAASSGNSGAGAAGSSGSSGQGGAGQGGAGQGGAGQGGTAAGASGSSGLSGAGGAGAAGASGQGGVGAAAGAAGASGGSGQAGAGGAAGSSGAAGEAGAAGAAGAGGAGGESGTGGSSGGSGQSGGGGAGAGGEAGAGGSSGSSGQGGAGQGGAGQGAQVVVNLGGSVYPASVRKLGFNTNWAQKDPKDVEATGVAAAMRAPMVSGLIDTKLGPDDFPGDATSIFQPLPLFYQENGKRLTRTSDNLTVLREQVGQGGMINFLQLSGMPCSKKESICVNKDTPDLFEIDPDAKETTGGRWYPLSKPSQLGEMASLLADFAHTVSDHDGFPTIWALWQEPDHTLSEGLTKEQSVAKYAELYRLFAEALRQGYPDAVLAGPQQNQATGTNGDGVIDGAGYNAFVSGPNGVGKGSPVPLDYVSIQNYKGIVSTLETIQNTRVAYADPRFNRTTVMFNEWDIDKSKINGFESNYDTPAGLIDFLDQAALMMDLPDLSYALLVRGVFESSQPLVQTPVRMFNRMSPHRRPLEASGPGTEQLAGLASGDRDGVTALVWNRSSQAQSVDLVLQALPASLTSNGGQDLFIEAVNDGAPQLVKTVHVESTEVTVPGLLVPPQGLVMVRAGEGEPGVSALGGARYARHSQWCPRRGGSDHAAPRGMGHYDVRSGELIASVDGAQGVGLAGVVMSDTPDSYSLSVTLDSSGLPASDPAAVMAVQVDFLKADNSLATVLYRDPRFTGAMPAATLVSGSSQPPTVRAQAFGDGVAVKLPISADAPASWGAARRVMVSLLLAGTPGAATVSARLAGSP